MAVHFLDSVDRYHRPNAVVERRSGGGMGPHHVVPLVVPMMGVGGGGGGHAGPNIHVVGDENLLREVRRNQKEDEKQSKASQAALLGGCLTIICAGVAACAGKMWSNTSKELNAAVEFREHGYVALSDGEKASMKPILDAHIKFLESKVFWAKSFVVLTVAALSCGVAAFVGGMFLMPWLITAAIVAGVFIAAVGAFAGVWYMLEDRSLSPEMLKNLDDLRARMRAAEARS